MPTPPCPSSRLRRPAPGREQSPPRASAFDDTGSPNDPRRPPPATPPPGTGGPVALPVTPPLPVNTPHPATADRSKRGIARSRSFPSSLHTPAAPSTVSLAQGLSSRAPPQTRSPSFIAEENESLSDMRFHPCSCSASALPAAASSSLPPCFPVTITPTTADSAWATSPALSAWPLGASVAAVSGTTLSVCLHTTRPWRSLLLRPSCASAVCLRNPPPSFPAMLFRLPLASAAASSEEACRSVAAMSADCGDWPPLASGCGRSGAFARCLLDGVSSVGASVC